MSGRVVVDTNIVAAYFAGEPAVVARCRSASCVYVPAVVLGELYYGAYKSARPAYNLDRLHRFVASVNVLKIDKRTGDCYGEIKNSLRAKDRPIPDNDLWIAAVAKQHDCVVLTRDKHFSAIDAITVETC